MDYSLPGSSVHGILQARILEWVAISFTGGSSPLRVRTQISCIESRFFTVGATREAMWNVWPRIIAQQMIIVILKVWRAQVEGGSLLFLFLIFLVRNVTHSVKHRITL